MSEEAVNALIDEHKGASTHPRQPRWRRQSGKPVASPAADAEQRNNRTTHTRPAVQAGETGRNHERGTMNEEPQGETTRLQYIGPETQTRGQYGECGKFGHLDSTGAIWVWI